MKARLDSLGRLKKAKGGVALLSAMAIAFVISLISIGVAHDPPPKSQRGAVGADFHATEALSDWGTVASLQIPADEKLTDDDVFVTVEKWSSGNGQTQPTTTDTGNCNGTLPRPTAPEGKVCIYVAGGDNAQDVNGYSVRPGTKGSRFGFKLAWTNTNPGDTFIDAVWVYNTPD